VRIFPLLPPCGISVSPSLEDLLEIPSHQTTGAPFFVLLFAASPLTEKPSGYPRLSDSGCAFFFPFFFAVWCCRDVAPPRCRLLFINIRTAQRSDRKGSDRKGSDYTKIRAHKDQITSF